MFSKRKQIFNSVKLTGTLIVVTLFKDLLFGVDGTNKDGEDNVTGILGKGGLKEPDGELERHSVQLQLDDWLECDSSDSDETI